MDAPLFLYAFWAPIHDSVVVQVMLVAILILVVADLVFGMLGAVVQKNFSSTKIREGLAHKCSEFAFLIVADVVDALLFAGANLPFDIPNGSMLTVMCLALIVMEIASLAEIATRINPGLADTPVFRVLKTAHIIGDKSEAATQAQKEGE